MRVNWVASKVLITLFLIILGSSLNNHILAAERLKLGTTTSTENSGLLNVLIPSFEKKTGIKVDVISVGTGKALKLGENGDVDVVLVHDRNSEYEFVLKEFGVNRKEVMYNDFILIGPKDDPAGIRRSKTISEAFQKIYNQKAPFISRGDDSGTYKKEMKIWRTTKIPRNTCYLKPQGSWYKDAGQSMETVIFMADNLNAYTLADRATYIALKKKIHLNIIYQKDSELRNPYGIIAVNPAIHKGINYQGAMSLINWITSKEGQQIIKSYKISGQQLFYPVAAH